jgi:hydrogenase nickel incorporation protein HypA/HybF
MHEWSLAVSLIEGAEAEARRRGAMKVHSLTLRVGVLTGVVPELLERAYEMARIGTFLEGAVLCLEVEKARATCASCGGEAEFEDFFLVCPACGAVGLTPSSGEGLVLTRMELDMPEGADAETRGQGEAEK